jgi:hypothetical protein
VLIAVGMAMAPIPIGALLAAGFVVKATIVAVLFAEIDAEGTVFAVVPFMVIVMMAIVVAMIVATCMDNDFLSSAGADGERCRECGGDENESEIFHGLVQVVLRKARVAKPKFGLLASVCERVSSVCAIRDR